MGEKEFEFVTGFVSLDDEQPGKSLTQLASERVARDAAQALAQRPREFAWDATAKMQLSIAVEGQEAALSGLVLDSCARVVASGLRVVGLMESESQIAHLHVDKLTRPSSESRMLVKLERW